MTAPLTGLEVPGSKVPGSEVPGSKVPGSEVQGSAPPLAQKRPVKSKKKLIVHRRVRSLRPIGSMAYAPVGER